MSNGEQKLNRSRRGFLGAAAALTLAPGVFLLRPAGARPASEPASQRVRWGMLIDTTKCKPGCNDCVSACREENGWGGESGAPEQRVQWMRKVELRQRSTGFTASLPMMCQHCAHPPCVDVCPTGASFQRPDGIVLVDKHICIGCRFCMMACPYKARSFVHEPIKNQKAHAPRGKGTVESCTLCVHRVDKGGAPACVESCPEGAMVFGDLKDPQSAISQRLKKYPSTTVRGDLRLEPGVRYEGI